MLGRIPTPASSHYIYALWFKWGSARRCFYIGKSVTDKDRVNVHDCTHGAKSSRIAIKVLLSLGLSIHRQVIDWYDKEDLVFWERYWWTVYKTLGHPLANKKPGKSCFNTVAYYASLTEEQRKAKAAHMRSYAPPDQIRIFYEAGIAANKARTPKQKFEISRKAGLTAAANMTSEERRARGIKGGQSLSASQTTEQKRERAQKAGQAAALSLTSEQKQERARKGAAARWHKTINNLT